MLKINNDKHRNVSEIAREHYFGVKELIQRGLNRSTFEPVIKAEIGRNIENLIMGQPEDLIRLEDIICGFIKDIPNVVIDVSTQLNRIFNYDAFVKRNLNSKWSTYTLAKRLNINTCLYCNRQYTFTIQSPPEKITRPQFDHFFPKDSHPLLALSFYNLIPSCSICNGPTLKWNLEMPLDSYLHPYKDDFGNDGVFTWIPKSYKGLIGKSMDISIKILEKPTSPKKQKIINQKNLFKLEEIYSEHSDYIQEIILKAHITKGQYLKWFQRTFGIGISNNELYRIAFNNYLNDHEYTNRVLSKLTGDIVKELDLT